MVVIKEMVAMWGSRILREKIKEYSKSCDDVDPERLELKLWSHYVGCGRTEKDIC